MLENLYQMTENELILWGSILGFVGLLAFSLIYAQWKINEWEND